MTESPGADGVFLSPSCRIDQADIVRFWVIASITISILGITYISMARGYGTIVPQLFYFPILYTTYFYPKYGIWVAGGCAAAYLFVAAFFIVPDPYVLSGVIFQALLFLAVAVASGYVVRSREDLPYFVPRQMGDAIHLLIKAGESGHREFKLQAFWSMHLTKEEINASESPEVKKYRTNASRFIIARSIAGFLNTDGGDLIIGIKEDRLNNAITITGIENDYPLLPEPDRNPDGFRRNLVDAIIRRYLPEIFDVMGQHIHISFPEVSGKTLCHVHVTRSDRPVFLDSGTEEIFFIRVDASTRPITGKTLSHYLLTRFAKQG